MEGGDVISLYGVQNVAYKRLLMLRPRLGHLLIMILHLSLSSFFSLFFLSLLSLPLLPQIKSYIAPLLDS